MESDSVIPTNYSIQASDTDTNESMASASDYELVSLYCVLDFRGWK